LLHLCLHTSYQHQFAFGLRPSCDIAETIACFGSTLDWRTLTERAERWGWQRGVYLALQLAKELAGADVPADILGRLQSTDVTEAILENARAQVFTDARFAISIPAPFAELLLAAGFSSQSNYCFTVFSSNGFRQNLLLLSAPLCRCAAPTRTHLEETSTKRCSVEIPCRAHKYYCKLVGPTGDSSDMYGEQSIANLIIHCERSG
jgi:hypothetical protein